MRVPVFFPTILFFTLLTFGCGGEKQETSKDPDKVEKSTQMVATPLPNADDLLARKASGLVVEQFSTHLRSEMMKAMAGGDIASAIEVCSKKAPALAQEWTKGGSVVRRVSLLNRNTKNYPTAIEASFLQKFSSDSTLKEWAFWNTEFHQKSYNYYRPIYMQSMCKSCHGKTEEMDPAVVQRLRELYPSDRAVGFEENDLRGMFVVSILWPQGKARAEEIVKEYGN